jgi:hypothetical protein
LVQPEDDVPFTLPTIPHLEVVLQDPEIDQSLDIRAHHDQVELRMMEIFQQVDANQPSIYWHPSIMASPTSTSSFRSYEISWWVPLEG